MTPKELRKLCTGGPAHVYLSFTRPGTASFGKRVHLASRASPLGDFCNAQAQKDGTNLVTACFQKADVLAWLDRLEKKK